MANKSENKDLVLFPQEQPLTDQPLLFEGVYIRHEWVVEKEDWFFSLVDVVEFLTDSVNATDYLKKMRKRDVELDSYIGTNCPQVAMRGKNGKLRNVLAANSTGVLRLIQSIPSPKAEPFKMWLAQVVEKQIGESVVSPLNAKDKSALEIADTNGLVPSHDN